MKKEVRLAITSCENYEPDSVRKAILQIVENSDFPDVKGRTVLLKPNILSDAEPSSNITTNPEVVRNIIRIVKERGAEKVLVGDSPGLHTSSFHAQKCGIYNVCIQEGAQWCNFAEKTHTVSIPNLNYKLNITDTVLEADVIIGISKMKNHQLMYLTGCVKNFFGTVPNLHKSACHLAFPDADDFASLIVNLHEIIKPAYSFMDAVLAMEGPGPANGNPKPVNLILGSDNDYATDTAQAFICGYDPKSVPILKYAGKSGLIPDTIVCTLLDYRKLLVTDFIRIPQRKKTKILSSLVLPFFLRKHIMKKQQKRPAPTFNREKCILCQKCVKICPAKALSADDNKINIDTEKCIRCYCCDEMCSEKAISIKGNKNK